MAKNIETRVVNGPYFEARTRARNNTPEPGPSPTFILAAQKPNLPSESRYAQLRVITKRSVRI